MNNLPVKPFCAITARIRPAFFHPVITRFIHPIETYDVQIILISYRPFKNNPVFIYLIKESPRSCNQKSLAGIPEPCYTIKNPAERESLTLVSLKYCSEKVIRLLSQSVLEQRQAQYPPRPGRHSVPNILSLYAVQPQECCFRNLNAPK